MKRPLSGSHGKRKNSAPNLRRIPFTERWNDNVVALFMRSVRDTVAPCSIYLYTDGIRIQTELAEM